MVGYLFLIFLLVQLVLAKQSPEKCSQQWQTLSGDSPVVIARGGFSGLFPESSQFAYQFAISTSLPDVILYCDLQLTKDGTGICQKDLRLDNSTNIAIVYPSGQKTYNVNGENIQGWFAVDFTENQLFSNVTLTQSIFSRPSLFDDTLPLITVGDVTRLRPPNFWLNVQYDMFYKLHNLNVGSYIQKASKSMGINYISSPEIGFLKSLNGKLNKDKTKFIFQFLDVDAFEPTTNQTYGSILENLSTIISFASGILVPKSYIWPINADQYLESHTNLVADAHKQGLEVHAYGFANDMPGSFNYSYDPTSEYLQFINNSEFSVDGVVTDFPPTASEAMACLAQNKKTKPRREKTLVISHNGASGIFAASSDLAYQQAVDDGADIIDCSVQMTKDGVPFCLDSPDLIGGTTAIATFMSRATMIPEIQQSTGIFSFDLSWSEIQTLKTQLTSLKETNLPRNPANNNKGKLVTLSEFLDFAKVKATSGILINIENAAYLALKKGLSIIDAVANALSNATLDKQVTQQVFIQSDNSAVLSKFKNVPTYKKILTIEENIGSAPKQSLEEIKKFADAVNLHRSSIITTSGGFTIAFTDVVDKMHSANISVYVSVLRNEFTTIAFDFFSDPIMEIATFVSGIGVDGIITEYPATASAYLRSPCFNLDADVPYSILPAQPGALISLAPPEVLPPAEAPAPALQAADIVDPPLPPVLNTSVTGPASTPTPRKGGQPANVANVGLCVVTMLISFLSLGYFH